MMGIASPTGSHLPSLTAVVESLPPGSLVLEHGAGMYSTPLLCRYDVRVLCSEAHAGWSEWARWMYTSAGREHQIVDSYKRLVPRLTEAAAVFTDGEAKERGPLLAAALERCVPRVVAHDTDPRDWGHYGFQSHHFEWRGYSIAHFAEDSHRTTVWTRHA
jgi:hypothetical protein